VERLIKVFFISWCRWIGKINKVNFKKHEIRCTKHELKKKRKIVSRYSYFVTRPKNMFNISNFLQKFLSLEKDNNTKLAIILKVIKKETNIDLSKEMLEIKMDNVKLNCNPVFRNEIFMHRPKIEELLKEQKIYLNII